MLLTCERIAFSDCQSYQDARQGVRPTMDTCAHHLRTGYPPRRFAGLGATRTACSPQKLAQPQKKAQLF